ncbi:hypothetical protein C4D60_Mb10t24300 [Musa balbisiana]|uniref:BED-type domain-containing protein n=1 Tax=Musa balbisiana TaxID=52838 RepID=A0A4S8J1X9_MUSBA|nr:hypothetical protein C4D60_Mb10t24300 [Musa balbisiana]
MHGLPHKLPTHTRPLLCKSFPALVADLKIKATKTSLSSNMISNEQPYDDAWAHARKMDENCHHWLYIYCDYIGKDRGITQVKMHLAGEYPDVTKYKKVPTEVRKSFRNKLHQAREDTTKKKARVEEEYCRTTQEPVYDNYEGRGDEIDLNLIIGIRASLEHQYMHDEAMRHR